MKMKRKMGLVIVSMLICSCAFAGCAEKNDATATTTSEIEKTQTEYQWDTTLRGSLFIGENQFGYKGYSKNIKYSEIFTEADDVKKNTTGANKYSATVREAQKFSDFSTGNVAEKYIFSTEDDLLNAVVVILTPDSGEAWSNFNERAAEAFQTVFAGKTIQKQESTAKEDGIAIMGNWQVKDDSGNSITIEFGSEIDITVKFN
jgi:hypothetical protein